MCFGPPFGVASQILDATNTTKARRALIAEHCREKSFRVLFVESVCEDDNQIRKNIMQVKIGLPDYSEKDATEAFEDFKVRCRSSRPRVSLWYLLTSQLTSF